MAQVRRPFGRLGPIHGATEDLCRTERRNRWNGMQGGRTHGRNDQAEEAAPGGIQRTIEGQAPRDARAGSGEEAEQLLQGQPSFRPNRQWLRQDVAFFAQKIPCASGCPVHVKIPQFMRRSPRGSSWWRSVPSRRTMLSGLTGRVCPSTMGPLHPLQDERRGRGNRQDGALCR